MTAYLPIKVPDKLEPQADSQGCVHVERTRASLPTIIMFGLFLVVWYRGLFGIGSAQGSNILFTIFMSFFGIIPGLFFFGALQTWSRTKRLDFPELRFANYPIVRGQQIQLNYHRNLINNLRTTKQGLLEWQITCAEITKTDVGTTSTVSHQLLWQSDLKSQVIELGAQEFSTQTTLVIPETLPASIQPLTISLPAPNRFVKKQSTQWIEYQVRVAVTGTGINAEQSRFLLTVA